MRLSFIKQFLLADDFLSLTTPLDQPNIIPSCGTPPDNTKELALFLLSNLNIENIQISENFQSRSKRFISNLFELQKSSFYKNLNMLYL